MNILKYSVKGLMEWRTSAPPICQVERGPGGLFLLIHHKFPHIYSSNRSLVRGIFLIPSWGGKFAAFL